MRWGLTFQHFSAAPDGIAGGIHVELSGGLYHLTGLTSRAGWHEAAEDVAVTLGHRGIQDVPVSVVSR